VIAEELRRSRAPFGDGQSIEIKLCRRIAGGRLNSGTRKGFFHRVTVMLFNLWLFEAKEKSHVTKYLD
jgi:hypothetical protein